MRPQRFVDQAPGRGGGSQISVTIPRYSADGAQFVLGFGIFVIEHDASRLLGLLPLANARVNHKVVVGPDLHIAELGELHGPFANEHDMFTFFP